jgi:PAS domain S-box-containing protein
VEAFPDVAAPSAYEALVATDQIVLDAIPAAICVCSADGVIVRFNQRASALWGRVPRVADSRERYCGALRLYQPDGTLLLHAGTPMEAALRTGEPQHDCEMMIERPDGSRIAVRADVDVLRGDDGAIQGAINCFHDITARRDEAQQLREKEQHSERDALQLASIVESSDDAIISKDLNGVVTTWNRGAERLFGYTAEEAVGKSITMLIPADHLDEEPGILRRIRAGERIEHYETQRLRKDGSMVDISLTVSPMRSSNGTIVGASKIAHDIGDRKRAEAQRNLLVAELSHRVKNTLATVISIARQSFATNPDAVEAQRSFNARIRALGQTHTRLAEAHWSGVPLETVLLDELAPYRHENGANLRISGPVTILSARQALTLGMAMHELATNAAKYGALSTELGVVEVRWDVDAEGKQLRITWTEHGGPAVVPPRRNGFGRLLIEKVLASDLGGDVSMHFAESGLECAITVPLSVDLPATDDLGLLMPA